MDENDPLWILLRKPRDHNSQRNFRIPLQRPGGDQDKPGWWYAHFDGQYVARQSSEGQIPLQVEILRDTINTSCDIEVLEVCRHLFHRWLPQKAVIDHISQRYFRIPLQRPGGGQNKRGWWYAHFDGMRHTGKAVKRRTYTSKWKYCETQSTRHATLKFWKCAGMNFIAGKDDMQVCEESLEETSLTRKRAAKILQNEFNKEWEKNGGNSTIDQLGK